MRTVPRTKHARIEFYATRLQKWVEQAEVLGLDPGQLARMQAQVDAARAALGAQYAARMRAQAKTFALRNAMQEMSAEGASILRQIRARSVELGPQAYILGSISAPEKGSPIAPPGTPHSFTNELTTLGTVVLRWKCDNPRGARGTTYHVSRRLPGGEMAFLGIAGRKKFEDATLPPGAAFAEYRVQAFRSTTVGKPAIHTVNFGFSDHGLPVPGPLQLRRDRAA